MITKQRKILFIFFLILVICSIIYLIFHGWFFAYTDDAFIRGNIAIVSPRVKGHVQKVYVNNSQIVKKGELLLDIDPTPFQLKLNVAKSTLKQVLTELDILKTNYITAQNKLKSVLNEYKISKIQFERYGRLSKTGSVARQEYEDKLTSFYQVKNNLSDAEQQCKFWQERINAQMSVIDSAESQVSLAEYYLSQTKITSPSDGCVLNCNIRPGEYVDQGTGLFSVIENNKWWINANYKEWILRKLIPGQRVYIFIRMYPNRIFTGKVKSIATGTSREQEESKVLPYVKPTTDWIIESRRFSVVIEFDEAIPEEVLLCEGANARTLIIL